MALLKRRAAGAAAADPADAPRPLAELLAALRTGGTPTGRREAALELAATPEAVAELAAALGAEDDRSVREAIVAALAAIGTEPAAAGLAGFLRSEDAQLRNAAIGALQEMGTAAAAHVERLLGSPDPDARIFAVNVLEALRHPRARDWLLSALERDPEVNVGLAAVEALAQSGGPEDAAALRAFAARFPNEPVVGFAVDLACRRVAAGGGA